MPLKPALSFLAFLGILELTPWPLSQFVLPSMVTPMMLWMVIAASEARQTMECDKWFQGRGLACHTRVSQKHFYLTACWSLMVAVPAAPPPHGLRASSASQPARSQFSPLPRRSPCIFIFFFLHAEDAHSLAPHIPEATVDLNSQFLVLSSVGLFSDHCILWGSL